ncbi:hypothetical protein RhiirC2_784480 [Rhizophagus irregularis]|uniref:F-box domain-containing protein n=1 Tax=Rhizophagus irregularis TaxID=588596 RepID=A0A2N1MYM3_9GLOM|nr:hypothetical protein RhiirC2_784480 [Rhizophagus irregularis]
MNYFFDYDIIILLIRCSFKSIEGIKLFYYEEAEARGNSSELENLPELLCEIIQYFRNYLSTLYSCVLVNKLWCRLAIPLLWEDPFSIYAQNFQFIDIYLCNLNEDDKTKFNEYVKQKLVNMESISNCSSTLFNYYSFIKCLNTHKVVCSIEKWRSALMNGKQLDLSILVYRLLFKMFIENEGNLHSFEVEVRTSNDCNCLKDIMELILQNPNFNCNIRNLMFSIDVIDLNIKIFSLLKFLCFNCNSISSFYIGYEFKASNYTLFEKCLTQTFNTQQNLEKISFECDDFVLYNLFSSLKNSSISNTLKIITFYKIDFKKIINNIQEIFNQLNILETIHIIYCSALNSDFVQQIINVIRPFKLKSLILSHHPFQVESLQLLLQKFGSDLENFEFGKYNFSDESKQKLFKSIIEYCTKIKYFSLKDINFNLALNLIENIKKQNLNYLNISFDYYGDDYKSENLGQILPTKLEFLKLDNIKSSDLKKFFKILLSKGYLLELKFNGNI